MRVETRVPIAEERRRPVASDQEVGSGLKRLLGAGFILRRPSHPTRGWVYPGSRAFPARKGDTPRIEVVDLLEAKCEGNS